jgi:perosamine synthetase
MPSELTQIPLCDPSLDGREREYVDEVLRSGWVSSAGLFVNKFEAAFAERLGLPEAVAVASGTAALHLALLAVGVRPDDEVLVSSLTFIAPANAVRYAGAWPVFIDAEPDSWQMDLRIVREFLEKECRRTPEGLINRATGRRISAILPVHILGHPVDMEGLMEIATAHGLKVIEDATESLGAFSHGRAAGTIGHVGCFSFNGNKLITSGGGGMVVAGDSHALKQIRYLSTQAKDPGNEYIHQQIGYNYRLTNLQAALGFAQFEQLDDFLQRKRAISEIYHRGLGDVSGIEFQKEAGWAKSAWWLFTILAEGSRDLIAALAAEKITARPLWQPMHLSPAHAGSLAWPCPVADRLFARGVSLPSSVALTEADQLRVCEAIRQWVASHASLAR